MIDQKNGVELRFRKKKLNFYIKCEKTISYYT